MALRDLQSNLSQGAGVPFVTTPMLERSHTTPAAFSPPPIQGGTNVAGIPLTFPRTGTDTSPFITGPITGRPILYTSWTGYFNTTDSFLLGHGSNLFSNSPPKLSPSQMYAPQNLKNSLRNGYASTYNNVYIPNQHYQQDGFNSSMIGSNTFNYLKLHGLNLQNKYTGPVSKYSTSPLAPQRLEDNTRQGFNSLYSPASYVGNQYYGMDGFNSALRGQPTFNYLKIHGLNLQSKFGGIVSLYSNNPLTPQNIENSLRRGFNFNYNISSYVGNQYYGDDGFNSNMQGLATFNFLKIHGQNLNQKYGGPVFGYSGNPLTPQNIANSLRKGFLSPYATGTYIGNQYYGDDGFNSNMTGLATFNYLKIHGQNLFQKYTGPLSQYTTNPLTPQNIASSTRKGFLVGYATNTYVGNQYYGMDGFNPGIQGASSFSYLKIHGQNLQSKYIGPVPNYNTIPLSPQRIASSIRTGYLSPYATNTYVGNQYYGDDGFNSGMMGANLFNHLKIHGQNLQSKYGGVPSNYSTSALNPKNIAQSLRTGFAATYNTSTYIGNQYYGMDGFNSTIQGSSTFSYLKAHGQNLKSKYTNTIPKYSSVGFKDPNILSLQDSVRKGFATTYATNTYVGNQYYGDDGFNTSITGQAEFKYLRTRGQNLLEKYEGSPIVYSANEMYKIDSSTPTNKLGKALGAYPVFANWLGGTGKDWKRTNQAGGNYNYKADQYYGHPLGYGHDLSGGGSSKLPTIVRRIGQNWYAGNHPPVCYVGNVWIRGGATTHARRVLADAKRIAKWQFGTGCGLQWNLLQIGLQLTNPKTESTLVQGTRIFNPLEIGLNILGAGKGIHVQRHGIPFVSKSYEQVMRFKNGELLGLWKKAKDVPIIGPVGPGIRLIKMLKEFKKDDFEFKKHERIDDAGIGNKLRNAANAIKNLLGKLFGSNVNKTLSSKLGGPHSVYGIGSTKIHRSSIFSDALTTGGNFEIMKPGWGDGTSEFVAKYDGTKFFGNAAQSAAIIKLKGSYSPNPGQQYTPAPTDGSWPNKALNKKQGVATWTDDGESHLNIITDDDCLLYNALTFKQIADTKNNRFEPGDEKTTQEALKKLVPTTKYPAASTTSGVKALEDPARATAPNASYWTSANSKSKPNSSTSGPVYGTYSSEGSTSDPIMESTQAEGNDLINVQLGKTQFMAYMTGLSDKFNPKWEEITYVGRPNAGHIYKGVGRDISFSLMIAALTKSELETVWGKCNRLAQTCAPGLTSNAAMTGPLQTLIIGRLITTIGYVNSLSFAIDDTYVWDIEKGAPMYVKVDIGYTCTFAGTPTNASKYYPAMLEQ